MDSVSQVRSDGVREAASQKRVRGDVERIVIVAAGARSMRVRDGVDERIRCRDERDRQDGQPQDTSIR